VSGDALGPSGNNSKSGILGELPFHVQEMKEMGLEGYGSGLVEEEKAP
jgi:hypothetical protein